MVRLHEIGLTEIQEHVYTQSIGLLWANHLATLSRDTRIGTSLEIPKTKFGKSMYLSNRQQNSNANILEPGLVIFA